MCHKDEPIQFFPEKNVLYPHHKEWPKVGPSGVHNTKYKFPVLYLKLGSSIVVEYKNKKRKKNHIFYFVKVQIRSLGTEISDFFVPRLYGYINGNFSFILIITQPTQYQLNI